MNRKTILSFGEVLWDIMPSATVLGGAPLNFSYRINFLGDLGLMVSRLGHDSLGKRAYRQLKSLGLETKYIQWDENRPTGTVEVSFDRDSSPDYVIIPDVAYDAIELTESLIQVASKADCVCFGTVAQRSEIARSTLKQLLDIAVDGMKFLDINLRKQCFDLETVTFSLEKADILKLNEDEAQQIARMLDIPHQSIPKFCEEMIKRWSLQYCLVTLAENGAFAFSSKGEKFYDPGYKIELADSLGAGDAFSAGFVHEILRGASIKEACESGNVLGAVVATQEGATCAIRREGIRAFLTRRLERNIVSDLVQFSFADSIKPTVKTHDLRGHHE